MKRTLVIVLIVLLAATAGFIYFIKDEVVFSKETSMYKAVPVSAPVFLELSALKSIPLENPIIKGLLEKGKDFLFLKKVGLIDSLIQNNKEIQNSLRNEQMILAFDFVGENEIFPLLIAKVEKGRNQKALQKFLSVLYPSQQFSSTEKKYSKQVITAIRNSLGENKMHFCFSGDLFLASSKELLLEKAIRQVNTQSILNDSFFEQVNKTATSQAKISCYINHQTFQELVSLWLNNRSTNSTNEFGEKVRKNFNTSFKRFRNFAAWSELDVKISENEIALNGISAADDSLNHFLSVFDGQEPIRFQADKVLPKNTSFFTSYTFSDKSVFFENLEKYFTHTASYYKREDQIKKMESGFRTDFKNAFRGLVKNELIVATTSIPTETARKTTLFLIQTNGKTDAEVQLNSLLSAYSNRKKIELNSLKSAFQVDNETNFIIYKFPYPSFPGIWLGKPFGLAEARFAVFYDNFLVFCNSEKGLQEYLYNMVLETSLDKDIRYSKFKQNIASRTNINSYVNVNRIFSLKEEVFKASLSKEFENYEEYLRTFQTVNWQVVCEKGISFNSLKLSFNQAAEEEAQTTWQSNIGTQITGKPQLVTNHTSTETREIILQDEQNNLRQITSNGRVRWSIQIPEPITSEIHQIDYFRNGRLQYLFNTKNKLYLIDREGNNVAHFPVDFRSPATNGVNVFDYDNNRKYRYFVACENKKVYAYDSEGKILTGWRFGQTDFEVTNPVQHFRVNNKDYIVFNDRSRIYIQHRNGVERVKSKAKLEYSNNPLVLNTNGKPKIVATDKTGKVFYQYFDGTFVEKKTAKFSATHFFDIADINGNGVPDFIFVDGNELTVMNENGKKIFSEKFRNNIPIQPGIYTFSEKLKKIGIVESSVNRIYLFDPNGKEHEGFPLQGNSEFSIGEIEKNSGVLNLIVGSKGGDLYNYTLN